MPAPSCLILIRHGESTWNAEERLQGQADPPLSATGRDQAAALVAPLAALRPSRAICSDLDRARSTARIAGFPEARPDARWRELDLGIWTTRLGTEVAADELAAFRRGETVPAGGEGWPDLQARVAEAVEELAGVPGRHAVFTHGGPVRAAAAHLTGAPITTLAGPGNCSITLLELAPLRRLLAYNRTADLTVPAPSEPGGTAPPAPA